MNPNNFVYTLTEEYWIKILYVVGNSDIPL
jgi:hypothetical protein